MKIVKSFDELIDALGFKPGDTIQITGSQHDRLHKLEIDFIPQDKKEFEAIITTASDKNLKKMGFAVWTTYKYEIKDKKPLNKMYLKEDEVHYLFPHEWYNSIPNGYKVIDINGEKEKFINGKSDDDKRFGCLPYGFIRNTKI